MKLVETAALSVPAMGFGTWQLERDDAYASVRHAIDVGYRHIDTAQIYGNEEEVGRAVADAPVDREELFLVTKLWRDDADRGTVPHSTEASLRRLGVDHVDLLLLHWPSEDIAPLEDTLAAMVDVRERGLTRHIGVSNFPSQLLARAAELAPIVTDQVEHHPFLGIDPIERVAEERDLFLTAYSPMADGRVLEDPTLLEVAEAHDASPAQVALAWLLQRPRTSVLTRSRTPERIEQNLAALDLQLGPDEVERIDGLARGERVIDPPFAPRWDAA